MPWTREQRKVARAVQHGFKPTGSAKGFTEEFADLVVEESGARPRRHGRRSASSMLGKGAKRAPRRR
jgi:hypothetical protein